LAKSGELALSSRKARGRRRHRRGEGVHALGEPFDLAAEPVEPVVARLRSLRGEGCQGRADLLQLAGAASATELGPQRVELGAALVELAAEGRDVPILARERCGGDRDRGGEGGETICEDVDPVRQATFELGVVLGRGLDRTAELLRGLLIAREELGRANPGIDLVDPGRDRLNALLERAAEAVAIAVRKARHASLRVGRPPARLPSVPSTHAARRT
jgi:hypothetical protein